MQTQVQDEGEDVRHGVQDADGGYRMQGSGCRCRWRMQDGGSRMQMEEGGCRFQDAGCHYRWTMQVQGTGDDAGSRMLIQMEDAG